MVLVSPAGLLTMPPQGGGMDKVKEGLSAEDQKAYEDFLRDYFNYRNIFSQNEKGLAALNSRYSEFYLKALQEKGVTVPDKSGDLKEAGGWMVHALYIAMGREYDHRNELKKVTAPVLVVHGENDLSPVAVSAEYADLFPNGTLVVIPGASHFSFEEQPGRFAETVGAFLND
jgi:pimeloyl-ACP methyl ester carboxylesterase